MISSNYMFTLIKSTYYKNFSTKYLKRIKISIAYIARLAIYVNKR